VDRQQLLPVNQKPLLTYGLGTTVISKMTTVPYALCLRCHIERYDQR